MNPATNQIEIIGGGGGKGGSGNEWKRFGSAKLHFLHQGSREEDEKKLRFYFFLFKVLQKLYFSYIQ